MAEQPQGEYAVTTALKSYQTTTNNMPRAKDSVVEAADDKTDTSACGTPPTSSSVVAIVSSGTNNAIRKEAPASSSVIEAANEDSKKRKAGDDDPTTPAKKQKPPPPEGSGTKPASDEITDAGGENESAASASAGSRETQKDAADASQAGGRKQKPQYESIEELREVANATFKRQAAEISDLKSKVRSIESARDEWQLKVAQAEADAKHAEDTKDARDHVLWKKAQDWKKKELQHQVGEAKQKFQQDLERAKAGWQKKLEKEQDKVEDLKKTKAAQKGEISDLKKQLKSVKPGDSQALKEKSKELEACQHSLAAQKTQNDVLAQRLANRHDDLERIREQRADLERKAKHFHSEWTKEIQRNDTLKADHDRDVQKQHQMLEVQARHSHENQIRLVGRQRGLFELNHAHDRVCDERDHLKKHLKMALAEIERLKTFAAPQPPRPHPVLPTPSDTTHVRQDPSSPESPPPESNNPNPNPQHLNRPADPSRAATSPDAEAASASPPEAAESHAPPELDATITANDQQVAAIVNELIPDGARGGGEPPLASTSGREASEEVDLHPAMRGAHAASIARQLREMQTAGEDAGGGEEDEVFGEGAEGVVAGSAGGTRWCRAC